MPIHHSKVLVVDDEVEVTYALQAYFQQKGYEMVTAFDGAQAMAQLETKAIDLVLLDLKMPGVNGVEYRGMVESLGVHGFLNKPFGIEALTHTIEKVLEHPAERMVSLQEAAPASAATTVTPKAKLLLVEPSEYLCNIKRVFFESPGRCGGQYQVDAAYSTVEAIEKLHHFRPDIVLVDLLAAGSLGDLATQLLRSSDRPKEIIVHGSGTMAQRQQERVEALTRKGVQLVLNETFTQAGLQRLNTVVRDVALQHGLTA